MRSRHSSLANYAFLYVLCATASVHSFADPALAYPELRNTALSIRFDAQTGRLTEFKDVRNGHEFLDQKPDDSLWEIDLPEAAGGGVIRPSDARAFRWRQTGADKSLDLIWEDFVPIKGAPEGMRDLRVIVTVSLSENAPESRWKIALERTGTLHPAAIRFPRVPAVAPQEEEVLAVPVWMGERTTRARDLLCGESGGRFEWEYPGILSMQCMAFYRENGPGLYLSCDDTDALAKRFAVFGNRDRDLEIELTQLMASDAGSTETYRSSYQAVLGAFEGDWFTVAEQYRRWGLRQSWAKQSRLKIGATADWVNDTGLWIWNRGRSDGVLTPALALQAKAQMPVSVFWHWWHGCAYDTGFPEYLPPREGVEAFKTALGRAQDQGIHALVYMNQRLWGMNTSSWAQEGAEQYAVKGADGRVHPEVYNTFTRAPCASMCMGTPFWRNKYAGLATEAVTQLGVNGIYMDQACSSLACFDASHGHPLGGGSYWMNGFRLLQADIRKRCDGPRNVVLAGEGCGETWLPYLDVMLSLQVSMERYAAPGAWEPIPFFHAVYHGYGVFFGNYSSLTRPPYDDLWPPEFAPKEPLKTLDRKFSGQFRLEQARAFVWGQQPTIANFLERQCEERADEIAYALRLSKLRYAARKYLLSGTMLSTFEHTGQPALEMQEAPTDFSRLSIYAGQQEPVKEFQKQVPAILASAWQAPDGDIAIVLANITDKPWHFSLTLDEKRYPITEDSPITVLDATGQRVTGNVIGNPATIPVDLGPEDAQIHEFESLRNKQR